MFSDIRVISNVHGCLVLLSAAASGLMPVSWHHAGNGHTRRAALPGCKNPSPLPFLIGIFLASFFSSFFLPFPFSSYSLRPQVFRWDRCWSGVLPTAT